MIKKVNFTGFCNKDKCMKTIGIDYVFNPPVWEKGTGECPEDCDFECEIIKLAPSELQY